MLYCMVPLLPRRSPLDLPGSPAHTRSMPQDALSLYPLVPADDLPALSAAQMRDVDRLATQDVGLDLLMMMENAGRALALVVRDSLPAPAQADAQTDAQADEDDSGPILVFAGSGNNGGGALAAARHLRIWGYRPAVVLSGPPAALGEAAALQHRILHKDGMRFLWPGAPGFDARFPALLEESAIVVDGLIGYGMHGPLQGDVAVLVEVMLDRAAPAVISLNIPSGFDATTGAVYNLGVVATATLTLAQLKSGLLQGDAAAAVGEILLADIGIPRSVYEKLNIAVRPDVFAAGPIVRVLTNAG